MTITLTREALLEKLAERLAAAKADDAARLKEHDRDRSIAVKKFREALRVALKFDYATCKTVSAVYFRSPAQPKLEAPAIARMIAAIQLDSRKCNFRIATDSDLGKAMLWKPESERDKVFG